MAARSYALFWRENALRTVPRIALYWVTAPTLGATFRIPFRS
jgi:hypothetical protein